MASQKTKKLLLPLDGSERGLRTIRDQSYFTPFQNMEIQLFHVFNAVPETYWDLEKEPVSSSSVKYVRAWEFQKRKEIQEFMDKARALLISAGFSASNITIDIRDRAKGVARDILAEAENGYDAVITRRRGFSALRGITIGSVAVKLLDKLSYVPMIVSGRQAPNKNILIAMDGSAASMRAVDRVADFLGDFVGRVCLVHVLRSREEAIPACHPLYAPTGFVHSREKEIEPAIENARISLSKAGIPSSRIESETISGVRSRAEAIAEKAAREKYGVIVMGRKGLTHTDEFFLGRVTHKVVQMATHPTIWIVP
jgi:nucleotide-binding universal stress UspA family protein